VTAPHYDQPLELCGAEIVRAGAALASQYVHVRPASLVLLLLPHSVELYLLYFGLILQGYCPAILPWPTRRVDADKYQRNLLHHLRQLPASQLITTPGLAGNLSKSTSYIVTGCTLANTEEYDQMFLASQPSFELGTMPPPTAQLPAPEDALFIQFSGGTTGLQKAVAVSPHMLEEQLGRLQAVLDFSQKDSVVSWLPLYHDMGLIACLWLPLWSGASCLHFANNDWLLTPELLFRYMDHFRGSFCWLPNFAFSYLAERRPMMAGTYSLQHVRAWINCSEPVRATSLASFAESFASWGVSVESLQASYAMAENVFAVTQSQLGYGLTAVSRRDVNDGAKPYSDLPFRVLDPVFVSSGMVLPDTEIKIVGGSGQPCPARTAGEIHIRTPSLFAGYWSKGTSDSSSIGNDGFYRTGDYGFVWNNELFVIGRIKDIIINAGQNVFPEDIEAVVNSIDGIYPGRVVAFGVAHEAYGTEMIAVTAEMKGDFEPARARSLEQEIRSAILAATGIAPRYVSVVPERWIVKSTAGKISRRDTRERFLQQQNALR
jgi:acyl-CoA synthetase (AMP-forming)/AMP-acid ligase II